jgi:rare lipoprotein A
MKYLANLLLFIQIGIASFYGGTDGFDWNPMANGQPFDSRAMTIAHNTLPLNSWVIVENPANGVKVKCKVTDRGGFTELGRVADLSLGVMCVLTKQRWRIKSLNSRGLTGLLRVKIRRIK